MKQFYSFLLVLLFAECSFAQQAYYNSIDFNKTGIDLKTDLATLITNTHTRTLDYDWNAIQATDVNPANNAHVFLLYGWEEGNDGDCTNDLERDINSHGGSTDCSPMEYNREHVYAKSRATPAMSNSGPGADGHHIRASDVQRNGQRGNKKFADGSGHSGTVNGGSYWYPGNQWKGDVARVIMYMYLRYGSQCLPTNIGVGSSTQTPDAMIDLFLKWNAEDPPSAYETQRNDYHDNTSNPYAQGNRNPFIDNPAIATVIWGGPEAQDTWGTLLSTKAYTLASIKIYPNPVKTNYIYFSTTQDIDVIIYDVLGKKVKLEKISVGKDYVDISKLNKGLYLVKLKTEQGETTKKLLKQ